MNHLNDIEEFTVPELRIEILRRYTAERKNLCWYCGKGFDIHTCKHKNDPRLPLAPTVVCLCGSSRFKQTFIDANRSLTLQGKIVLSIGMFGHEEVASGFDMDGPVKAMLDQLHFRKIELADEVFVLNLGGYVGESTANEIRHAMAAGKPVKWLETPDTATLERFTRIETGVAS